MLLQFLKNNGLSNTHLSRYSAYSSAVGRQQKDGRLQLYYTNVLVICCDLKMRQADSIILQSQMVSV